MKNCGRSNQQTQRVEAIIAIERDAKIKNKRKASHVGIPTETRVDTRGGIDTKSGQGLAVVCTKQTGIASSGSDTVKDAIIRLYSKSKIE